MGHACGPGGNLPFRRRSPRASIEGRAKSPRGFAVAPYRRWSLISEHVGREKHNGGRQKHRRGYGGRKQRQGATAN